MRLHDYVNDVYDIADAYKETAVKSTPKFLTNVSKGEAYYQGSTADFAALKPKQAELTASSPKFLLAIKALDEQIIALRAEGKRDEATALVQAYN